jgi:hypothetical protein
MFDLTKYPRLAALLQRRKPTGQTLFPPMREIPVAWDFDAEGVRRDALAKAHLQEMENEKNDLPF